MNRKYLSCDDLDDALRSLAMVYGVENNTIRELYDNNWPDFLPEYEGLSVINLEYFNDWIGCHFGVKIFEYVNFDVAFYHRTRFDGKHTWFKEGILDSISGANSFIEKIKPFFDENFDIENFRSKIISNIKGRTALEGKSIGGPYAFDWLDAAKNAPGYDVPEFLCGRFDRENGEKIFFLENEANLISQNLIPVIVKFLAKPRCYVRYVNSLWEYVYRIRFDYEISQQNARCSFTADGNIIPSERIVKLFSIP